MTDQPQQLSNDGYVADQPAPGEVVPGLKSVLIVVAHPDDEVLGAGATAAALATEGHKVRACILSGQASARSERPTLDLLRAHILAASRHLGMEDPILGPFPNMSFNTVPTLELVQFVEDTIKETNATVLFTHHPGDLNDDHLHTSRSCQAASRVFQRKAGKGKLDSLHFMEILSSTDWAYPGPDSSFRANLFCPISRAFLERKIEALERYEGVLRPFPHSRSPEVIRGLAALRGAQAGVEHAEGFETVFRISTPRAV